MTPCACQVLTWVARATLAAVPSWEREPPEIMRLVTTEARPPSIEERAIGSLAS